jgi:cytochrome c peroxidase
VSVARLRWAGLLVGSLALVAGCGPSTGEPDPSNGPTPLAVKVPAGFPPMIVPADNPTTVEGVALGRQLFYDKRLSRDGTRACGGCHVQENSFSSGRGVGVLPHVNLAWSRFFLWDGSTEGTLEDVMRMEVEDFFETEVERLREPDLEALFLAAFGTAEVTREKAALALAQFQRTLVSGDSRYDRHLAGDQGALTASELRGLELFNSERAECFHCHGTALFTNNLFHNNGLDEEVTGTGRGAVTGRVLDDGAFKTPTLRNIAQTAPYMHDDRFATLEEVIDFYSEGVKPSYTIDPLIPNPYYGGIGLTAQEKADLVAFLRSLTDQGFLTNPALAAPPGVDPG